MSQPIIEVRNLSKRYRLGKIGMTSFRDEIGRLTDRLRGRRSEKPASATDFWALRDVSFDVQPGEVVGIIGRNGAGKSTLLKILSRITDPTSGDIIMRGRLASLLEVGTGFHPELSGRENVFLNGAILGMKKAEIARKFDEIVAFSEIEKFIDTPVKRYSSGMYVRLAFAIAAHLDPDILIVDEVLAVGDADFQRKCIEKMESIRKDDGRTILFVSHNMEIVRRLCRQCVFLEHGQVKKAGPVEEVARLYQGAVVRQHAPGEWIDLHAHPRRASSAKARFTQVRYLSSPEAKVFPGQPVAFECEIESSQSTPVRSLAVTIYSENGAKLLNYDTITRNSVVRLEPGANRFAVQTAPLPLTPGTYTVGLWLEINAQDGPTDWIEAAFYLEVAVRPNESGWAIPYSDGLIVSDFSITKASP